MYASVVFGIVNRKADPAQEDARLRQRLRLLNGSRYIAGRYE
jgi:hypothetical protein